MGTKTIWDGEQLPPIGCEVLIHLGRTNVWVRHVVESYGVRPTSVPNHHLIDINVIASSDKRSSSNQRFLGDVRPVDWREDDQVPK